MKENKSIILKIQAKIITCRLAQRTDVSGAVDVAGHDANLALAGLDDTGAVGACDDVWISMHAH